VLGFRPAACLSAGDGRFWIVLVAAIIVAMHQDFELTKIAVIKEIDIRLANAVIAQAALVRAPNHCGYLLRRPGRLVGWPSRRQ